jgi:antitoxin Phd
VPGELRNDPDDVVASRALAAEMDALEDAEDIVDFDAAMAEVGEGIPWEQLIADLGWK